MAKKKVTEGAVAIAPSQSQALARPSWARVNDVRGSENIESNDVTIPRLSIAQALSPQLKRTDPAYIAGLSQLDLFNTVTSENYGSGPLRFSPLVFRKRAIEFIPRSEGGGVLDASVPVAVDPATGAYRDARLNFGPNGEAPRATLFHEWICVLLDTMTLIAISMKASQLKVSKQLNYIVREDAAMRKLPAFSREWSIRTTEQTSKKGTFGNFVVRHGAVHGDEIGGHLSQIFDALAGKSLNVAADDQQDGEENVPF